MIVKTAMFQTAREQKKVECGLCSHRCIIPPGKRGICAVRENNDGVLYSLVYDKIIATHVDPIEKKPLFHVLPGSASFSIATPGCNFRCKHCQNSDISQLPHDRGGMILGEQIAPDALVASALKLHCTSISYTYTEPTIYFELAYDTAQLAKKAGLKNIFVTNGYITPEALREIAPFLDAANIDLKGFRDEFYRTVCGAKLQPVLDAIKLYRELGIWAEITTLIIPGYNDAEEDLRGIARFIRSVGDDVPWHVSRFHPTYKLLDSNATPQSTLRRAREIGLAEGLHYVYEGNIPGEGEDTVCPKCGAVVLKRMGYRVISSAVSAGKCMRCGSEISGVWA
ncbi:MAG TPA: AmmeMemoRadiSam system radical SAM enzyme [Nitrospirota bacterium]|nr:AmmeMemoRadiSam system radical SAM enzyme [Nitrospirota bacterium]